MGFKAAARRFLLFILSVQVVTGEGDWSVAYTSTEICAVKGSTATMSCTYTYPSTGYRVRQKFWYTKSSPIYHIDLRTDLDYSSRVRYEFVGDGGTLTINDLRESDSAMYRFSLVTNQTAGKYPETPGVLLNVTDLKVQVRRLGVDDCYPRVEMKCGGTCHLPGDVEYVWYKNGWNISEQMSYTAEVGREDTFSCGVKGHEKSRSPPVYAPKPPSVSVSPSGEIVEGSSVTLSCSSDANPAAKYTWYKENNDSRVASGQILSIIVQSSDSGEYYCGAKNELGRRTSQRIPIDVKYAPKPPSVSVNLTGQIKVGSSVTLSCSSDANPAAEYTWYKENEDSPVASGQTFTITSVTAEHSGTYNCKAQNDRGGQMSKLHLTVVADSKKLNITVTLVTLCLAMAFGVFLFLYIRKRNRGMSLEQASNTVILEDTVYENPPAPVRRKSAEPEEQHDYVSINLSKQHEESVYCSMKSDQLSGN